MEELDPRTQLRFAVLTLDGHPVAYHLGFEAKGKFVFYQPAFDIDYWKWYPGEVLMRQLLLYAQDRGLSEFDLSRGGEAFKDRFATHVRENLTVFFNHDLGARRQIRVGFQRADGKIRESLETLRKYPPAYRFARGSALRCLNFWRRERQLKQHKEAGYPARMIRRIFRNLIFARDVTVVYPVGKQETGYSVNSPDAAVSVGPATLSTLAVIAAMNPGFSPSLGEFQNRLAAGQKAYLVRHNSKPAQIWCVTSQSDPAATHYSYPHGPRLIVEPCWTAPWFRGNGLFRYILRRVSAKGVDVLVSCPERDPITHEMRTLGLRALRRKMMHFRVLHSFRHVVVFQSRPSLTGSCENAHATAAGFELRS